MPKLSDLLGDGAAKDKMLDLVKSGRLRSASGKGEQRARQGSRRRQSDLLPDFVALDFETTGLEAREDRVMEVGAVRFHQGVAQEEFSKLVNPGKSIPPQIVELTGIRDRDVVDAPPFSSVVNDLLTFLGNYPICGHQIEFDIGFLNEELKRLGMPRIGNQSIDTALLARIVLPRLAGYSLGHVARTTGQTLDSAHRAPDDARASGCVAVELLSRLEEIPAPVRRKMALFSPPTLLKRLLGRVRDDRGFPRDSGLRVERIPRRLGVPESYEEITTESVREAFCARGSLSRTMGGFSPRPSQEQMALKTAEALNTQSFLVAEAGTGTGKSLAYLVPSALFALKNQCRVLVSTHTRNLQDQLVSKDLPVVAKIVGEGFRYAVLKGRANYICRHRFDRLLRGELGNLSPRERSGVLPLIRWAEETECGDIEEQTQFSRKSFHKIWNLVSADSHHCLGRKCPDHGSCFLQTARLRAQGSHVVVINHALFFSEVCAQSSFLGKTGPLVFDEAHHLQGCGYQHLRVELDTNRINNFVESLVNLQKRIEKNADHKELQQAAKNIKSLLRRFRKDAAAFLGDLDKWVSVNQPGTVQFQLAYRDNPFKNLIGLGPFEMAVQDVQDLLSNMKQLCADVQEARWVEELESDVSACSEKTSQLKADSAYLCAGVTDDHVFWIEGNHRKGWAKLCGVPLDIGPMLGTVWAGTEASVVFTSATLSVAGSFDFFMPKLGLVGEIAERTVTEVFESPFGPQQSLRVVSSGSPEPDSPDYPAFLAETLAGLYKEVRRNTLVLFTSHAMLRQVYALLRALPGVPKRSILAQGITGNRNVLLDEFRQSRGVFLLGTDSFWEGIDAPGEACEVVVIARLPFPVPTHPLTQAIAKCYQEENGESFISFSVPEAVIKFRQGTGRLIRSIDDRGVLIVLDKRAVTKGYGKLFLKSLGGEVESVSTPEALVGSVSRFFG